MDYEYILLMSTLNAEALFMRIPNMSVHVGNQASYTSTFQGEQGNYSEYYFVPLAMEGEVMSCSYLRTAFSEKIYKQLSQKAVHTF